MKSWFGTIKTAFFIIIALTVAPSLLRNLKDTYTELGKVKTKIGRVTIDTVVVDAEPTVKNLKKLFEDSEIKAILLKIECRGGYPGSCQAIFSEIQELKKESPKPIIALVENMCASGGYYIACAADRIIATKGSIIGSIGVTFSTGFNVKELAQQHHIQTYTVSSGKYKTVMNPFEAPTPEQLAMLQSVSDDNYQQFVSDVAKTRKLSPQTKDVWAEGKIFTGQQALELHLIDEIGSYTQAVSYIKTMATIEGTLEWVEPDQELSLVERLLGRSPGSRRPFVANVIAQAAQQIRQEIQETACL